MIPGKEEFLKETAFPGRNTISKKQAAGTACFLR